MSQPTVTVARKSLGAPSPAGRHRALAADIPGSLPAAAQRTIAETLREFADAAGEVSDSRWPRSGPAGAPPVPRPRPRGIRGRAGVSGRPGQTEERP